MNKIYLTSLGNYPVSSEKLEDMIKNAKRDLAEINNSEKED